MEELKNKLGPEKKKNLFMPLSYCQTIRAGAVGGMQ